MIGNGAIAIPRAASVEAITTSATDDSTSQPLGVDHRRWRSRSAVERSLVAEHDREKGQGLQRVDSEPNPELADRQYRGAKD
jgi:hypothetical protein